MNQRLAKTPAVEIACLDYLLTKLRTILCPTPTETSISPESLGRRTFTTFDVLNRPIAVRSPRPDRTSATPVTTSAYDVTGSLVQSTDALGRTTWRQYDALGRLTAETSPLGPLRRRPPATPAAAMRGFAPRQSAARQLD